MKEKKKFQMPAAGCVLLSAVLIVVGCILAYLEWFRGYEFGRRNRGLFGIVFFMLGVMVLYRGMQGKEFRFWHKNWQPLGEVEGDIFTPRKKEEISCPHCKNKLTEKEEYCPICGRKI